MCPGPSFRGSLGDVNIYSPLHLLALMPLNKNNNKNAKIRVTSTSISFLLIKVWNPLVFSCRLPKIKSGDDGADERSGNGCA